MNKLQMLKKLIRNQIERGIIQEDDFLYQVSARLSYSEFIVKTWYQEVFGIKKEIENGK